MKLPSEPGASGCVMSLCLDNGGATTTSNFEEGEVMTDRMRVKFSGQAGYEVDCGHHKKTRVVFGMIDDEKTTVAWYLFTSTADKKSQKECAANDAPASVKFGYRTDIGRTIPHSFEKKIAMNELAQNPKGTYATLNMDSTKTSRMIGYRIDKLKTKAGEVVTFPFGTQQDSQPSRAGEDIEGKVLFLETASFDEKKFHLGPQGKDSQILITGGAT
ncbi:hypothetical protein Msil_2376 [Methylocella silvestris BL2]|uniref:Uncharacterized protein n=2 Tax=Methylocella silvestris TaxID=199596 RepID=B8EII7_METSB|nr:hypothetical protein Msil_2376 [Methylocella silvestris BL2]